MYVCLQTPLIGRRVIDVNSPSFSYVFEYLSCEYKREQNPKWELPLPANDFAKFLSSGPTSQCERVVEYIVLELRSLDKVVSPSSLSHDFYDSSRPPHHALPYLWFCNQLALRSKFVCQWLVHNGLLIVLRNLWGQVSSSQNDTGNALPRDDQDIRTLSCILLGIVSCRSTFTSLAIQLLEFDTRWFLQVFSHFLSQCPVISTMCMPFFEPSLNDQDEFYRELLLMARYEVYFVSRL